RTEYEKDEHGFNVINAMEANDLSVDEIVSRIKQTVGDKPVYLTFDIDCLDPAFAPGTGTPVCGGLNSDKILKIIRGLQGVNMVGMDVVEVSPAYDQSDITALAGATIALELLYVWTANRLAD
ncbi:arginase family protein, partial [Vibrio fortis]